MNQQRPIKKVETGVIILKNLPSQEAVDTILKDLELEFPDCTYEQSGVEGSYVIIERCGCWEESRYA